METESKPDKEDALEFSAQLKKKTIVYFFTGIVVLSVAAVPGITATVNSPEPAEPDAVLAVMELVLLFVQILSVIVGVLCLARAVTLYFKIPRDQRDRDWF